jgi:glycosyltransferase involved in cell wall biosynthesis
LILAVGRLIAKKGFADLIHACGLMAQRGRSFRCEIIGDGPLENDLRGQIERLNLQNRVTLSGAKPQLEVRRRLSAANVFVLPSVIDPDGGMDNLPTVIMEAMATRLPVVSTTIGGIPEMVVENETGFLVQPGDALVLADAIEKVVDDRLLAQRLGRAGYERAHELFSIERNVHELCALICSGAL